MKDTIYREAAIEALREHEKRLTVAHEARGLGTVKYSERIINAEDAYSRLNTLPSADVVSIYSYAEELSENDALRNKIEQLADGAVPREEYNNLKEAFDLLYAYEHSEKEAREWTPCSERLPIAEHGESDTVIVTKCWKKDRNTRFVGEAMFNGGNWCTPTGEVLAVVDVLAWMPLPEPWKGDKNEQR